MPFAEDDCKIYAVAHDAEASFPSTPPRKEEKAEECPAIEEASLGCRFNIHDEKHCSDTYSIDTEKGGERTVAMVSSERTTTMDADQYFLFQSTVLPIQATTTNNNIIHKIHDEYDKMSDEEASCEEFVVTTTLDGVGDEGGDDEEDMEDEADETQIDLSLTESKLLDKEGIAARQKCLLLLGDQAVVHKKSPRSVSRRSSNRSPASCNYVETKPCWLARDLVETPVSFESTISQEDGEESDGIKCNATSQECFSDGKSSLVGFRETPGLELNRTTTTRPNHDHATGEALMTLKALKSLQIFIKKHIHRVRRAYKEEQRQKEQAAQRLRWIQGATQAVLARRIFGQMRSPAIKIQRLWRGARDRGVLRWEGKASTTIQRVWREHRARRQLAQNETTYLLDQQAKNDEPTTPGKIEWSSGLCATITSIIFALLLCRELSRLHHARSETEPHSMVLLETKQPGSEGFYDSNDTGRLKDELELKEDDDTGNMCSSKSSLFSDGFTCSEWGYDFGIEMNPIDMAHVRSGYIIGGLNQTIPGVPKSCSYDSRGKFIFDCERNTNEECSVARMTTSKNTAVIVKSNGFFHAFRLSAGCPRSDLSPGHGQPIGQIEFCFKCSTSHMWTKIIDEAPLITKRSMQVARTQS